MSSASLKRAVTTFAVLAVALLGAASASATTVSVSPAGATTGTAGAVQLVLNTARRTMTCTGAQFTATLGSGGSGVTLPFAIASDVTLRFSGCRALLTVNITIACTATARLSVTGLTTSPGGLTPVSITAISCTFSINGSPCTARLSGAVTGLAGPSGQLTISVAGQTLATSGSSNGSGGACPVFPNDTSFSITSPTGTDWTYTESPAQTITVT